MDIAVIGTGYVGLVTGAGLAEFGNTVVCIDTDQSLIASLQRGEIPIFEPGLEELVSYNTKAGRLRFTTDIGEAVPGAAVVFIAVGTPPLDNGDADLRYVTDAVGTTAGLARGHTVIAIKSTVPVGTARSLQKMVDEMELEAEVDVASNPEFLGQGSAVAHFLRPDRVVIGVSNERTRAVLTDAYRPLLRSDSPILVTTPETAELIKYTANAFLATKLAFMNEIADICEQVGADARDIAQGIGLDRRIGSQFLAMGPGFGGSCLPKDTRALARTAERLGRPTGIVEATIRSNARRATTMADKVVAACGGSVAGKTIAVLGLTFKANTDDLRESPSIQVIGHLQEAGAKIRASDPQGMDRAKRILPDLDYHDDPYTAIDGADAVVIATEWDEFKALDIGRVTTLLAAPVMVDLRNLFDPLEVARAGLEYFSVGQSATRPETA